MLALRKGVVICPVKIIRHSTIVNIGYPHACLIHVGVGSRVACLLLLALALRCLLVFSQKALEVAGAL